VLSSRKLALLLSQILRESSFSISHDDFLMAVDNTKHHCVGIWISQRIPVRNTLTGRVAVSALAGFGRGQSGASIDL
jgi:hypothetical protein